MTAAVAVAFCVGLAALFGGCAGRDGRDGASAADINIYDIYEAVKAESGNDQLTFLEFLKEYLTYTPSEIEEAVSLQAAINRSLLSGVSVRASFVENSGGLYNAVYNGSGVIIDVDRELGNMLIVTNCHVVYSAKAVFMAQDGFCDDIGVWLYGSEYSEKGEIKAEIMGASRQYDLALLKVENSDIVKNSKAQAAVWAGGEEVYMGERVYAVGNAGGDKMSATDGIISKDNETVTVDLGGGQPYNYHVLRTTAFINAGNSGGGLFNMSGSLSGIVNAKGRDDAVGIGYALPAANAKRVVKNLTAAYNRNGGEVHGAYLARHGLTLGVEDSYSTGLNKDGFVEIREIVKISLISPVSVYLGSLEAGDRLKHVKVIRPLDGGPYVVEDMDILREHNFYDAMLSVEEGDIAEITVWRGGEEKTFSHTFGNGDFSVV